VRKLAIMVIVVAGALFLGLAASSVCDRAVATAFSNDNPFSHAVYSSVAALMPTSDKGSDDPGDDDDGEDPSWA